LHRSARAVGAFDAVVNAAETIVVYPVTELRDAGVYGAIAVVAIDRSGAGGFEHEQRPGISAISRRRPALPSALCGAVTVRVPILTISFC
jgi:hypothetical protein